MRVDATNSIFSFFPCLEETISQEFKKCSEAIESIASTILVDYFLYVSPGCPRQREIQSLTKAIAQCDNQDSEELISSLTELTPAIFPASEEYRVSPIRDIPVRAIKEKIKTALKTYSCSFSKLWNGLEVGDKNKIAKLKSELLRLTDVEWSHTHLPAPHPTPVVVLPLSSNNNEEEWFSSIAATPVSEIPPYLYYYPHALDSPEGNNIRYRFSERTDGEEEEIPCYNPQHSWAETLDFIEQKVLKTPLQDLNQLELIELIQELHKHLTRFEETDFRVNEIIVFGQGGARRITEFAARFRRQGDFETEKTLLETDQIVTRWGSFDRGCNYFKQKHWEVQKKIGDPTPSPDDIDHLIDLFTLKLIEHLKNPDLHPYQIATFIHHGLVAIHPYVDANGRLARLFMNVFLMQKGFMPLVVLNDDLYTQATKATLENLEDKTFCKYLHESTEKISQRLETQSIPMEKIAQEEGEFSDCSIQ